MGSNVKSPRRFCEECGRVLESKRTGETLCRLCEERVAEELGDADRRRRKDRDLARRMEERFFLGSSGE
jgi:uncharacterized Zn finger protein (UPF0148 family)